MDGSGYDCQGGTSTEWRTCTISSVHPSKHLIRIASTPMTALTLNFATVVEEGTDVTPLQPSAPRTTLEARHCYHTIGAISVTLQYTPDPQSPGTAW